ncbi:EAL domain-containing protein [Neorhizobium sp. BETTINA12A]|uniref:bifunctional diguanylate cyclase/phosphodiesterase n=1 Tax=Neorhizobium sp. BETTINA12A TaxID=2908924 RepID=UPI001FF4278C|nr:EAL domain-containing protein [Neorhizobium sp. BETTINA12A]MCJ9753661.1 EAL domain-containing protein [Neorhizobium sp. BETTINA12A]
MKFWPSSGSKSLRFARSTKTPTTIAFVITLAVISIGVIIDQRYTEGFRSDLRATTEKVGGLLARRLIVRVETDIAATDHLVHVLRDDFSGSADTFKRHVEKQLGEVTHFSGVAVAPNFELAQVITRDGIVGGGAGKIGKIDLLRLANDLKSVSGRNRVSLLSGTQEGDLTLVVPVSKEEDGGDLWGAIAVLIDKQGLMEASGVTFSPAAARKPNLINLDWLNVVLRDDDRPQYFAFFGNDSIENQSPMKWTVPINGANWTLLAAPRSGWDIVPPNQLGFRLAIMLAALGVIVPIFIATSLISERNRNIEALKARELNLIELSQRFNLAMEASNIGIWEVTGNGNSLFWDKRAAGLHDKPATSEGNRLYDWLGSIYPPDRTAAETHFADCASCNTPCSETYRVQLPDGTLRYLKSAGANYRNADGTLRTTGIVWDVTGDVVMTQTLRNAKENTDIKNAELELALDELSNREQDLEELSSRLDLALDSYNCGIWESNPVTHIETWDARMCQLHGIPFTDGFVRVDTWIELIHPDDREHAKRSSYNFTENFLAGPLVVRVPQPDGSIRYIRSIGKVHTMRDGSQKVVGIAFDVTQDAILTRELKAAKDEADAKNAELELAKSRIEHNSLHDPLTLLANRRKLDMELDRLSRTSHNERQKFSILHLDLDRFKQINDTLGHAAGDAMLVHASRILSRNVRSGDIVARIGGDEFVILATDNSGAEEISQLAQRIIAEFHQPIDFEGFACRCGVSIGIAQASGMNVDARRTLVNADIALYRAKGMGRNRYEFFTQNLQAEIVSHKRTADEVLTGIDNDEFITFYQPQFDARTNQLTGVEALIRWNHPHHGILAPDRFLKIAEDLNVSAALDHIVLQTVLKDKMRWAALGVRVPKVSVNVSSKRLNDEALIDTLQTLAIVPGEISFELVESIFLDESEAAATSNLERIKELGIDIEIDDFGTGHTSIVSLLKLKPKRLKIDRQLVMPILISPQERALVRSIIDIARSLGVETVAEGVETMQHASLLRELGCDLLQGYAFARPLSFDDFTAAAHAGWRRAAA